MRLNAQPEDAFPSGTCVPVPRDVVVQISAEDKTIDTRITGGSLPIQVELPFFT